MESVYLVAGAVATNLRFAPSIIRTDESLTNKRVFHAIIAIWLPIWFVQLNVITVSHSVFTHRSCLPDAQVHGIQFHCTEHQQQ